MNPRTVLGTLLALGLLLSALRLSAEQADEQTPAMKMAGPYAVLMIDMDYLQDVTYMDDRIYLKRQVDHRSEAIILRASVLKGESYRKWFNGELDLISPANAGHAANAWTDWVETSAPYVEYWIGDQKILHLKRVLE